MKIKNIEKATNREAAYFFGIEKDSVDRWASRDGCPRNPDKTYDLKAVMEWHIARLEKRGPNAAGIERVRKTKLEADLLDIKLDLAKKKVLPLQSVMAAVEDMIVACRQRVLSIGQSIAPVVADMSDAKEIKDLINERCNEALVELAGYAPALDESSDADDKAAADITSLRMGRPKKKA